MIPRLTFLNAAAGGALGLTIGGLAGMAVSPVVGAVLGTLATGGIAFLTLRGDDCPPANLVRVIAFGLACLLGALGGVYIRANNILGVTPKRFIKELEAAGIKHEDAVKFYLQEKLLQSTGTNSPSHGPAPEIGALFAGPPTAHRDELRDMLRRTTEWNQISNNVRIAAPEWLNVVQAIGQLSLSSDDKMRLLMALAEQP
jgi:hypothetical protein